MSKEILGRETPPFYDLGVFTVVAPYLTVSSGGLQADTSIPPEFQYPHFYTPRGWEAYIKELVTWARQWATELADKHISEINPSFDEAQKRMMDAYGKFFELERALRALIEQRFKLKYGVDWYEVGIVSGHPKIPDVVQKAVNANKVGESNAWIDDLSISILRFTLLPNLRHLIVANWSMFIDVFGPNDEVFKGRMSLVEPQRLRIAHMNTLSRDDVYESRYAISVLLRLVRPHVSL